MQSVSIIDWESQRVLSQIAEHINKPLSEIIRLHKYLVSRDGISDQSTKEISSIILKSSRQIQELLELILSAEQEKQIEILLKNRLQYPVLYQIDFEHINPDPLRIIAAENSKQKRISKADLAWLQQLERIVIEHIDSSSLNLSWLSKQCATSERQLFRKIEKYTDLTPNKYIRMIRLHRAKELLEQYTCSTVSEVSASVGMRDPYYFSKLYEEAFGVKVRSYFG